MADRHGSFVWYELITIDPAAAERFYGDVVGWSVAPFGGVGPAYWICSAGGSAAAGMMALPAGAEGLRPGWLGYVGVDDVDAAVAGVAAAGGGVRMPAMTLAGVGRMAMVADAHGVPFYVMRGESGEASGAFAPEMVGHCAWNELATPDPAGAVEFYAGQFGWTKGEAMPMGAMGDYQFMDHGGQRIGAMMGMPPDGREPGWTFYFRVDEIDAAAARVRAGGGAIVHGPIEVPGGLHIIVGSDPQGVRFAVVGPRGGQ